VEPTPVQEATPIEALGDHVEPFSPDPGGQAWFVGFTSHLFWQRTTDSTTHLRPGRGMPHPSLLHFEQCDATAASTRTSLPQLIELVDLSPTAATAAIDALLLAGAVELPDPSMSGHRECRRPILAS